MSSELEELLVDGTQIDEGLLKGVLSPYIRIDKITCEIRPNKAWNELKPRPKILLYLLARKAMKAMNMDIDEEAASNTAVIDNTGVKKGTVHPALRQLLDEGILAQTKDKKYYIPNYSTEKVKEYISS